jgi:hypothetical protein
VPCTARCKCVGCRNEFGHTCNGSASGPGAAVLSASMSHPTHAAARDMLDSAPVGSQPAPGHSRAPSRPPRAVTLPVSDTKRSRASNDSQSAMDVKPIGGRVLDISDISPSLSHLDHLPVDGMTPANRSMENLPLFTTPRSRLPDGVNPADILVRDFVVRVLFAHAT